MAEKGRQNIQESVDTAYSGQQARDQRKIGEVTK
jgi:hypothetical protein